jgi:DNA-directed RNA polymerase specialized sigma24 family protein
MESEVFAAHHQSLTRTACTDRFARAGFMVVQLDCAMLDEQDWRRIHDRVLPRMFGPSWHDLGQTTSDEWKSLASLLAIRLVAPRDGARPPTPVKDPASCTEEALADADRIRPGLGKFLAHNQAAWQGAAFRIQRAAIQAGLPSYDSPLAPLETVVTRIVQDLDQIECLTGENGSQDREAAWRRLGRHIRQQARDALVRCGFRGGEIADQADECCQYVSLRLLERLPGFRFQASLDAYIQVAIRNAIIDFLRQRSRFRPLDDARLGSSGDPLDHDPDPDGDHDPNVEVSDQMVSSTRDSASLETPGASRNRTQAREAAMRAALEALGRRTGRGGPPREAILAGAILRQMEVPHLDDHAPEASDRDPGDGEWLLEMAASLFPDSNAGAIRVVVCRFRMALMRALVREGLKDCLRRLSRFPDAPGSLSKSLLDSLEHLPSSLDLLFEIPALGNRFLRLGESPATSEERRLVGLAACVLSNSPGIEDLDRIVRSSCPNASPSDVKTLVSAFLDEWPGLGPHLQDTAGRPESPPDVPPLLMTRLAGHLPAEPDLASRQMGLQATWSRLVQGFIAREQARAWIRSLVTSRQDYQIASSLKPPDKVLQSRLANCLAEKGVKP